MRRGQEVDDEYRKGEIAFTQCGEKLKGKFSLIKTKAPKEDQWLLIKSNNEFYSIVNLTVPYQSLSLPFPILVLTFFAQLSTEDQAPFNQATQNAQSRLEQQNKKK